MYVELEKIPKAQRKATVNRACSICPHAGIVVGIRGINVKDVTRIWDGDGFSTLPVQPRAFRSREDAEKRLAIIKAKRQAGVKRFAQPKNGVLVLLLWVRDVDPPDPEVMQLPGTTTTRRPEDIPALRRKVLNTLPKLRELFKKFATQENGA